MRVTANKGFNAQLCVLVTEAYKELKVKKESLFLFKTLWQRTDLSVGHISDCESVLKHVQWGEATSISSNTLCGFRITFGPIRHWNLAVNHGGRSSTVKLTHHNRFDHKPQIPSRPCAYKKTVTYLKIWSGPDSHIKHMPDSLITRYWSRWSQFWLGELDITYCLRWVFLLSELLKGHCGEHLYSETFQNKPSGFSEDRDVLKWTQDVWVCLLWNVCMCMCLMVRVFGYSFESQICPHKYSKTWLKLCLN